MIKREIHVLLDALNRWQNRAIVALVGVSLLGLCQAEASSLIMKGATIQDYHYTSSDRRDPFQTLENTSMPVVKESSVIAKKTLDLPKVRWTLLGIISGPKGAQAVIQSAEGTRYFVSNGDVLPKENMRVVRLTRSSVSLESTSRPQIINHGANVPSLELTFARPVGE